MRETEAELIQKALQGDDAAFTVLAAPHRGKIHHLCFSLVKEESAAEDLTQETFISAYAHLKDFKQKARFYTWIYRIALNKSLNYLRKKKREKTTALHEERVVHPSSTQEQNLFVKGVGNSEKHEKMLEEALKTLSHKQRIVFELFELQGVRQKEIAQLLAIPHGTVRSRLFAARKKVRAYFSTSSNNFT